MDIDKLQNRLDALAKGERFNLRSLLGEDWLLLTKLEKLRLGKLFRVLVTVQELVGVVSDGKDPSNHRWYKRN